MTTWSQVILINLALKAVGLRVWLPPWLWITIEQQFEALAVLRVDIEEARATPSRIEETTWGLGVTEIDGERFVVLLADTLSNLPWTVGGLP